MMITMRKCSLIKYQKKYDRAQEMMGRATGQRPTSTQNLTELVRQNIRLLIQIIIIQHLIL